MTGTHHADRDSAGRSGVAPTRQLVVNADDLGLSPGVNEGIVEAYANGIVTSASLMVNRPGSRHAAGLLSTHPGLSVGLHLEEDAGHDLDDPAQAAELFEAQLERFRQLTGGDPTHIDSHHHVHNEDGRLELFRALAEPIGVPIRHDGRIAYIGGFWAQWEVGLTNLGYIRRPFLVHLIANEARSEVSELACHPAKVIGDFRSSYLDERAIELATLTEPGLREEIEALGVRLVSHREVRL